MGEVINLVREPDAGNPPVLFDEREVETEHGRRLLRHKRGNPETEVNRSLPHRATSRLYPVVLRHFGLWNCPPPRPPPADDPSVHDPDEPPELTYVDSDTFEATLWADF